MPNQENSPSAPGSSGYVLADFALFLAEVTASAPIDATTRRAWKLIYYSAYLACYNRLMTTLRKDNDPRVAAEVTAAVREELIKFHQFG